MSRQEQIRETILSNLERWFTILDWERDFYTSRAKFFNHLKNSNQLEENDFDIYKMVMSYLSEDLSDRKGLH